MSKPFVCVLQYQIVFTSQMLLFFRRALEVMYFLGTIALFMIFNCIVVGLAYQGKKDILCV
jgi:hypothetical protein